MTGTITPEMLIDSTSLIPTIVEVTRLHESLNKTAMTTNYLFSLYVRCE